MKEKSLTELHRTALMNTKPVGSIWFVTVGEDATGAPIEGAICAYEGSPKKLILRVFDGDTNNDAFELALDTLAAEAGYGTCTYDAVGAWDGCEFRERHYVEGPLR